MQNDRTAKILANPKYQELVRTRSRLGWIMTIIMLVAYYSYIAVIAFDKELFAEPIGDGVMTLGIPVGFGVIVLSVIMTGIYVHRANTRFDALTQDVIKESEV